jgi:hypothetical protein
MVDEHGTWGSGKGRGGCAWGTVEGESASATCTVHCSVLNRLQHPPVLVREPKLLIPPAISSLFKCRTSAAFDFVCRRGEFTAKVARVRRGHGQWMKRRFCFFVLFFVSLPPRQKSRKRSGLYQYNSADHLGPHCWPLTLSQSPACVDPTFHGGPCNCAVARAARGVEQSEGVDGGQSAFGRRRAAVPLLLFVLQTLSSARLRAVGFLVEHAGMGHACVGATPRQCAFW